MKVTELLHDAVFTKPGSYVASPGVSSPVRIWLRSPALIVPSVIGISYSLPVLLSRTVRVWLSPVSVTSAPCVRRCGSRWQFGWFGRGAVLWHHARVLRFFNLCPCWWRGPVGLVLTVTHRPGNLVGRASCRLTTSSLWGSGSPAAGRSGPCRGQCSSEGAAPPPARHQPGWTRTTQIGQQRCVP